MTMVDDGVAPAAQVSAPGLLERAGPAVPVACVARPGTGLAHLDGACRCFVGGPPPIFAPVLLGTGR